MTELHSFNLLEPEEVNRYQVPCKACGKLIDTGKVWCDASCHAIEDNCVEGEEDED